MDLSLRLAQLFWIALSIAAAWFHDYESGMVFMGLAILMRELRSVD